MEKNESEKEYVMAVRPHHENALPEEWQKHVSEIEGVRVVGAVPRSMQVMATPAALEEMKNTFGSHCRIELFGIYR